jgi:hypothetical protein
MIHPSVQGSFGSSQHGTKDGTQLPSPQHLSGKPQATLGLPQQVASPNAMHAPSSQHCPVQNVLGLPQQLPPNPAQVPSSQHWPLHEVLGLPQQIAPNSAHEPSSHRVPSVGTQVPRATSHRSHAPHGAARQVVPHACAIGQQVPPTGV